MKTILITTDQDVSIKEIDGFTGLMEFFQSFPETLRPRVLEQPFCMIVNDAGKMLGLSRNDIGTALYNCGLIVGDVILMKQKWSEGSYDLVGLSDEEIAYICKKLGLTLR